MFKDLQFPRHIILLAILYYISYKLSYREIEDILAERSIRVDHATINRWVIRFAPIIEANARRLKRKVGSSWGIEIDDD